MTLFFSWKGSIVSAGLLVLLLLASSVSLAQAPMWQSVVVISQNSTYSTLPKLAADVSGNIYVAGTFTGTVVFGTTALTSAGNSDVFVAKWNPLTARFIWAQRAGGTGDDVCTGIAASGASVYLTGHFTAAAIGFGGITLPNAGSRDGFVAKLTDVGSSRAFAWAQQVGGVGFDQVSAVAATSAGIYVTGEFEGSVGFGTAVLTSRGLGDGFVAKLDDAGSTATFAWAQPAGGYGSDGASALTVSGTSVYVAGYFSGTSTCGSTVAGLGLNSAGSYDVFVAKLVDAGSSSSFTWATSGGGFSEDMPYSVVANGASVYVAGAYRGGPARFGNTILPSANSYDAFVAKLTDTGSASTGFVWAWSGGDSYGQDEAVALATNGTSVFMAGTFGGTMTFGSTTLSTGGSGVRSVFLCKLADAGTTSRFDWAQSATAPGVGELLLLGGKIYVAGSFYNTAAFGNANVTAPTNAPAAYLASLTDATLTATAPALAGAAFTVAPNPAHGTATVQLPALPGTASATLTLLDAVGRVVRSTTWLLPPTGLRHELSMAGLAPGLYALQVRAGKATATRKVVVE